MKLNPDDYNFQEYDVGPVLPKWQKPILVTGVPAFKKWDVFAAKMTAATRKFMKTAVVVTPDPTPLHRMVMRWAALEEAPVIRFHEDDDWGQDKKANQLASMVRYARFLIAFGRTRESEILVKLFALEHGGEARIKVIDLKG